MQRRDFLHGLLALPLLPRVATSWHDERRADVIIVGGGLNGPALALALAQGGFRVTVVDARPVPPYRYSAGLVRTKSRKSTRSISTGGHLDKHLPALRKGKTGSHQVRPRG